MDEKYMKNRIYKRQGYYNKKFGSSLMRVLSVYPAENQREWHQMHNKEEWKERVDWSHLQRN